MAVQTVTLTDFLMARIAEDEQLARAEGTTGAWGPNDLIATIDKPRVYARLVTPSGVTEISTVRVLAECEAKRRIVEWAESMHRQDGDGAAWICDQADEVLSSLAAVHADHADYREEWRADA